LQPDRPRGSEIARSKLHTVIKQIVSDEKREGLRKKGVQTHRLLCPSLIWESYTRGGDLHVVMEASGDRRGGEGNRRGESKAP